LSCQITNWLFTFFDIQLERTSFFSSLFSFTFPIILYLKKYVNPSQ